MKLVNQVTGPGGRITDYTHLLFGRVQVARSFQLSIIFVNTQRWGSTQFDDIDRVRRVASLIDATEPLATPDKPKSGASRRRNGGAV